VLWSRSLGMQFQMHLLVVLFFLLFKENNNNNNIAIFQNLSCLTLSWNQYPIYPLLSSFEMCWIQISLQCGDWKFWRNPTLTWSHGAELNCLEFRVIGRFLFFAACRKKSEQWLNYIIIFQGTLFLLQENCCLIRSKFSN
jgi:hypothetical protein